MENDIDRGARMDRAGWGHTLTAELRSLGFDGERLDMALRLWGEYNDAGVARDADDPALFRACPRCESCWHGAEHRFPPPQYAGISLPWLGERYPTTRICVIAINLVGFGGKFAHDWICNNKADALRRNLKRGDPSKGDYSYMGWATASFVDAIRRSQRGEPPRTALPEPCEVSEAYDDCAFLESIKCSPDGNRSRPTPAMFNNCPDLLLGLELRALKPSVLIVQGADARGAVAWAANAEIPSARPFTRGSIHLDDRPVEVFVVPHPAAGFGTSWKAAYPPLTASLATCPVEGPSDER